MHSIYAPCGLFGKQIHISFAYGWIRSIGWVMIWISFYLDWISRLDVIKSWKLNAIKKRIYSGSDSMNAKANW